MITREQVWRLERLAAQMQLHIVQMMGPGDDAHYSFRIIRTSVLEGTTQ